MDDYEARAERRRQGWRGDTVSSHSEMADADREFWASASARFDAVWEMAMEAWSFKRSGTCTKTSRISYRHSQANRFAIF